MNKGTKEKITNKNFRLIYLIIIVTLIFLFEYLNRNKMIQKSIDLAALYSSINSPHIDFLHKYNQIGDINSLKVMMGFIFLLFPINKSFSYLNALAYSSYIENSMKFLFGPRMSINDFHDLLIYYSNGSEYPSSNLLSTTCCLLSLWGLLTHTDRIKYHQSATRIKYTLLLLIVLFLSSIASIEVILQLHSINKVIYGICLGFSVYYILFVLFELHEMSSKEFFRLFKNKKTSVLLKVSYFVEIFLLFLLYYLMQKEFDLLEPLILKTKSQTQFGDNALLSGLSVIMLLGACYGLEYLSDFSTKHFPQKDFEINNWNKVSLKLLFIITVILAFYSFGFIVYSIIPNEAPFEVIIILKTAFPLFIISYALSGPAIASCIVLSLANNDIYENKEGYGIAYREDGLELRLTDNVIIV